MLNQHTTCSSLKIKPLPKSYKYYLNKSAILFGATDSGKSTILIEILYLLKEHVPNIFVFCPTADDNKTFKNIVPSPLIFNTIDIQKLEEIYQRQKAATKIYNTVNELDALHNLFYKVATEKNINYISTIRQNTANIIKKKQQDMTLNSLLKKTAIEKIKKICNTFLITVYKNAIRNSKKIHTVAITKQERYIIKYLDFNPNCIIVFDDCGAELSTFQKEITYKKIMYQGRHNFINIILTLQDDAGLDTGVKKNAFVNIFTTAQCAMAYFDKKSSSFTKKEKDMASLVISDVFANKSYKKFVYLRNDPEPFRFTIANIYDNFRFGSKKLWKLCDKVSDNTTQCDFGNDPLMSSFKIDI